MKNLDLNVFPNIEKNQWIQLAEKQLKGADPIKELAWENDAEISLSGYFDQSDLAELDYLKKYFSAIKLHDWKLYERIDSSVPESANDKCLEALMGGCDGVILDHPLPENINRILNEVNPEICDVCIVSSDELEISSDLSGFRSHPNGNCVSSEERKNPVDQLTHILQKITTHGYIHRIGLPDFFLEISTVRALRYLLHQKGIDEIHIHSHVPMHASDEHQWFLNTTTGLASILGGSHSIDLSTAQGDSRISRNTGNLIREESGIVTYSDQCGGAYYIEVLTDKIIKQVTEKLK